MIRDMFANGAQTRAIYFVSVAFHLKVTFSLRKSNGQRF